MTMINKNLIHPTVNDRLLGEWGAIMLSYEVGPCSYQNGYLKAQGKMFPVKLKASIGLRPITITLDFSGKSPMETARAISDLTDVLMDSPEIMLPDGFFYWCEFDGASTPERKAPWIEQVQFQLHGVRHEKLEEIELTASGTIDASGNLETPMIVTLTPSGSSMTFQGITITSNTPVTIDGVLTTVKNSNGDNVFGSTDMTKWPTLTPGENTITMSGVAKAEISYYPIWK